MRKILIFIALIVSSCDSYLDLRPKMQISAEEAFSNRENLYAVLVGCYDALQLQHYYGRNLIIVGDLASDNSFANGTKVEYYDLDKNSLFANNILVEGIWADVYVAINRVNNMLYHLELVDFLLPAEKKDIQAQLRFLRGLHYFNLVRLYGGVPLKLLPTLNDLPENFLPRADINAVYSQIIADLEFARINIINTNTQRAPSATTTAFPATL